MATHGGDTVEEEAAPIDRAVQYSEQAEKLAGYRPSQESASSGSTQAVEAKFVTPLDPVVVTAEGGRLPVIPIDEAKRLNRLKDTINGTSPRELPRGSVRISKDGTAHGARLQSPEPSPHSDKHQHPNAPLREAVPLSHTNPLFPPLPTYGPPSLMRSVQVVFFRTVSAVLSFCFLLSIVVGMAFDSIPRALRNLKLRLRFKDPQKERPFYHEERQRAKERRAADRAWIKQKKAKGTRTPSGEKGQPGIAETEDFVPTEGGPDTLILDVGYYARRVGLDCETFEVQTEDGFIIELWHIYNPREYNPPPSPARKNYGPDLFDEANRDSHPRNAQPFEPGNKKYPVLMIHGLLQSSGAFCTTDDDSFAFYLAKSGYDVWLGNNRCGFEPKHTMLNYADPRMWAWNIRQMGVLDLSALISRVLAETGFPKLALIAHSQGTTETFVALAKEQRPEIGEKISVFCALAPAVYAGPLIGKVYFKFMRLVPPAVFRLIFGIHSFIPLMMVAHKILPARYYGWIGYHVFSFLFGWTDTRWDRGFRNRMFQWAPVYVSSESMRWWLGRECFAKQKCILATREEGHLEDKEDEEDDAVIQKLYIDREPHMTERKKLQRNVSSFYQQVIPKDGTRGRFAWYDKRFPPLALWVCGADDLVDGRRLLRRFDRGREPHVRVVHKKIIEGYEHLDVIWAMDAVEKVGKEVREVIWRTAEPASQKECRVPIGCARPLEQDPALEDEVPMLNSGGRARMASISASQSASFRSRSGTHSSGSHQPSLLNIAAANGRKRSSTASSRLQSPTSTDVDVSKERRGEHSHIKEDAKQYGGYGPDDQDAFTDVREKANPLG